MKRTPSLVVITLFLVVAIGGWAVSNFNPWQQAQPLAINASPPLQLTPVNLNELSTRPVPLKLHGKTIQVPVHQALTVEACGPSGPKPLHWVDTARVFCLNTRAGSPPEEGAAAAFLGLGTRQGDQEVLTASGWRWMTLKIDKELTLPQVMTKLREMAPRGTSGEIYLPERSVSLEGGYHLYSGDFHHLKSGARVSCAVGETLVENKRVVVFACSRFTDGALAPRYLIRSTLTALKENSSPNVDYLPGGAGEQLDKVLSELESNPESFAWSVDVREYLHQLLEEKCPVQLEDQQDIRQVMDCREQRYSSTLNWIQDSLALARTKKATAESN